ncbi:MAG: ribbon-helix-helix protein, CopG family [Clostridia bacterium]|nr:ribbon-helix-helix protein, CopG family [Clostridia bacterium]MBQ6922079.1 ribbon-helix-helix protein, CopG family [Clostridia bacterium]
MARSEAQKAADKRYKETHKGDFITWTTKFKTAEAAEIDAVIKSSGMTRAEFIRRAVEEYKAKN